MRPGLVQRGAAGEKGVAGGDGVASADRSGEAAQATAIMQPLDGIRIAQEHRVVKVEHQRPDGPAQQGNFPRRQQFSLQDHIGAAQTAVEP